VIFGSVDSCHPQSSQIRRGSPRTVRAASDSNISRYRHSQWVLWRRSRYAVATEKRDATGNLVSNPVQILIVPAVISLVLFVALQYVLGPLWRRYRMGYSRILPLDMPPSDRPSPWQWLRGHWPRFVALDHINFSFAARNRPPVFRSANALSDDGISEDGEELAHVDGMTWDSLEQSSRTYRPDSQPRLSREFVAPALRCWPSIYSADHDLQSGRSISERQRG
jgi:hypothetical protein